MNRCARFKAILDDQKQHNVTEPQLQITLFGGFGLVFRGKTAPSFSGDRTGVRRVYEQCAAALGQELAVEPGPATQAAYEQLLRHWHIWLPPMIDDFGKPSA